MFILLKVNNPLQIEASLMGIYRVFYLNDGCFASFRVQIVTFCFWALSLILISAIFVGFDREYVMILPSLKRETSIWASP